MRTLKSVQLSVHHLSPGRTEHTIIDRQRRRGFPPFVRLEIAVGGGGTGCFLFHICADGSVADTWHEDVDEALHQAEFEFGVSPTEWEDHHEIC